MIPTLNTKKREYTNHANGRKGRVPKRLDNPKIDTNFRRFDIHETTVKNYAWMLTFINLNPFMSTGNRLINSVFNLLSNDSLLSLAVFLVKPQFMPEVVIPICRQEWHSKYTNHKKISKKNKISKCLYEKKLE